MPKGKARVRIKKVGLGRRSQKPILQVVSVYPMGDSMVYPAQALDRYTAYSSTYADSNQTPAALTSRLAHIFNKFLSILAPIFGMSQSKIQNVKTDIEGKLYTALNRPAKMGTILRAGDNCIQLSCLPDARSRQVAARKAADFFEAAFKNNPFTRTYSFTTVSFDVDPRNGTLNAAFQIFKGKSWGIFYAEESSFSKGFAFRLSDLQSPAAMNANYQLMYNAEMKLLS